MKIKKDKTYKFCNNDVLNHNIFSSRILVIKYFSPFISDCLLQVLKNFVPILICSNLVSFVDVPRRFEVQTCECKNPALTLDLGLSASAAGSCCIFTLAVRQPPVLASCIEILYYFFTHACKTLVCAPFTNSENSLFSHQCAK